MKLFKKNFIFAFSLVLMIPSMASGGALEKYQFKTDVSRERKAPTAPSSIKEEAVTEKTKASTSKPTIYDKFRGKIEGLSVEEKKKLMNRYNEKRTDIMNKEEPEDNDEKAIKYYDALINILRENIKKGDVR